MLKVGIHHGDVAGLAGQHSFDAGAGEAAPADSADAADPVSCSPISRATAAVPSGKSSSTKITSHSLPASTVRNRSTICAILWRSLNVGMTTVSSGAARATISAAPASETFGTMVVCSLIVSSASK